MMFMYYFFQCFKPSYFRHLYYSLFNLSIYVFIRLDFRIVKILVYHLGYRFLSFLLLLNFSDYLIYFNSSYLRNNQTNLNLQQILLHFCFEYIFQNCHYIVFLFAIKMHCWIHLLSSIILTQIAVFSLWFGLGPVFPQLLIFSSIYPQLFLKKTQDCFLFNLDFFHISKHTNFHELIDLIQLIIW